MLLAIISCLLLGLGAAYIGLMPPEVAVFVNEAPFYCLCAMLFIVGYGMGQDKNTLRGLFKENAFVFLVPVGTIIGTLVGGLLAGLILPLGIRESMAVAGGFGWYTYSAVYLAEMHSADLGAIAFLSNVSREMLAIILIPAVVRFFGAYPAVSICGATSMDVTLPLLAHYAGSKIGAAAFLHGAVLSFVTPLLLPLLIGF
jgi:uncharacterized membrane protein YbjE (DUF340 family)